MDLMKHLQSKKTLGKIELFLAQKYDTLVKNSGLLIEIRMTRYLELFGVSAYGTKLAI